MPSLTINQGTTIQQMQAFAKSAGDSEIRAKTDSQGVTTLYTHSKWKPSLNRDPANRAVKQQAGRDATANFIRQKMPGAVDTHNLITQLGNANAGSSLKGKGLASVTTGMFSRLSGMLQTPPLRDAYRSFCVKEHNAENINFIDRAEAFTTLARAADTPEKLAAVRTEARAILNHFIKSTGPEQVNLPSHLQSALRLDDTALGAMGRDALTALFDTAQDSIQKLMIPDTFRRFLASDDYKQALATVT
jgi:hypothetical protein